MDFLNILSEATNPVEKTIKRTSLNILTEAPKKTNIKVTAKDTEGAGTDYGAEVEDVTDNADNTEPEGEDNEPEATTDDDATDDDANDAEATDDNAGEDVEATDYTAETDNITVGGDEENTDDNADNNEDTTTDTAENNEDNNELGQLSNKALIDDFINLYDSLTVSINKLDNLQSLDMQDLAIVIDTKKKFAKLSDYIYAYVTRVFNEKTYSENLYVYKYIIQLYKISVEILSKISNFTTDTQNKYIKK